MTPTAGRLTATVLYAADGKHYVPVANDLRRRSARVDLSELGGGRRAALRVVVSDGVLTGSDASKRHRVAGQATAGLDRDPGERSRADGG